MKFTLFSSTDGDEVLVEITGDEDLLTSVLKIIVRLRYDGISYATVYSWYGENSMIALHSSTYSGILIFPFSFSFSRVGGRIKLCAALSSLTSIRTKNNNNNNKRALCDPTI